MTLRNIPVTRRTSGRKSVTGQQGRWYLQSWKTKRWDVPKMRQKHTLTELWAMATAWKWKFELAFRTGQRFGSCHRPRLLRLSHGALHYRPRYSVRYVCSYHEDFHQLPLWLKQTGMDWLQCRSHRRKRTDGKRPERFIDYIIPCCQRRTGKQWKEELSWNRHLQDRRDTIIQFIP